MAQSTVDDHDQRTGPGDREVGVGQHLREVLPALLAVGLLLGVVVAGGVVLRDLLDFGVWFLAGWE